MHTCHARLHAVDPLADGFNLTDGRVSFDIPCNNEIKSRNTYIVVLMGDSGNKSGNFTIHREIDHCPNLKPKKPKTAGASGGSNSTALPASTSAAGASTGATTTVAGGAPAQSPAPVQEEAPATDDTSSDSTEQA